MRSTVEQGGQPQQVVDIEKAHEMALAEDEVREWGKRYERFQENPAFEPSRRTQKWFADLQNIGVTYDQFVSHAEKRADMVGELYDYQQQLEQMSTPRIIYEAVKNHYKGHLGLINPTHVIMEKDGKPFGVEEEGKKGKLISYMNFRADVARSKWRAAVDERKGKYF
jgi:hypothetical protein